MIRVYLIDDHPIIHSTVGELINLYDDLELIGTQSDPARAIKDIRQLKPDIIILDYFFEKTSGLEVLELVHKHFPESKVVFFTMQSEDTYAARLIKAGAYGFVNKGAQPQELVTCLRKVHGGERYVSKQLEELTLKFGDSAQLGVHTTLSNREYEVFLLLALGLRASEISERLNLGVSTVHTYVRRTKDKMGMTTVEEMNAYARRMGLLKEHH